MTFQHLADFLLLVSGLYAAFRMFTVLLKTSTLHSRILSGSTIVLFVTLALFYIHTYTGTGSAFQDDLFLRIAGWSRMITIAVILCGLMEYIRYSKPEYARFPQVFIFLPLLLIVVWPFIDRTLVLKEWLICTYEGAGLVAGFLLIGMNQYKGIQNQLVLIGLGFLALSYLVFWLPFSMLRENAWIWELIFAIGLIVVVHGWLAYDSETTAALNTDLDHIE